jgi:hypothetical protein
MDATKKLPGEGFKRPWPPLIKAHAAPQAGCSGNCESGNISEVKILERPSSSSTRNS